MIFRGAIYLVNRGANSLSFSSFDSDILRNLPYSYTPHIYK